MTTHYIKEYIEKRIHNAKEMLTKEYGGKIPTEYTALLELVSKANIYNDSDHTYIESRLKNIANQYKQLEPNDTLKDLFVGDNAITKRLKYVKTPQPKYKVDQEIKSAKLENRRINLSGWNLKDTDLIRLDLTGANLRYTNLSSNDTTSSNECINDIITSNGRIDIMLSDRRIIKYVELTDADLSYANLTGRVFYWTHNTSTNFSHSNMNKVKFERSTFKSAIFFNTKLEGSTFSVVSLSGSTFTKTSFNGSKIKYSDFMGATFNESTMRHCVLDSVNFVNAKLNETDFEHSTVNVKPDNPNNPNNPYNKGEVDFRRVSLSNTNSDKPTQDKISLGNVKDVKSYAEAIHSVDKDKDPFNRDIHGIIAAHIHTKGGEVLKEHMNSLEIKENQESSQSPKKSNNTLPFMNNSRTNKNESKQTPDEQLNM